MRAYELMVIVDSGLDDEVIDAQVTRVADLLKQRGAEVRKEDRWGKRRFAYEINHKQEGYYVVFEFVGGTELAQLERALRLADEIVRHKLLRLPDAEAIRRGLLEPATS
ncbi:MAG TPA: 30S ribosomal protein S6 [Acidimicrobiales bacterium]|jgi:small subunit ribosomal protein S6